jgi:hypothetical protein
MYTLNKPRLILTILIMAAAVASGPVLYHDFYVSLAEIRYNRDSHRLEISMRIFPDDMDRALEGVAGIKSHLVTELEIPGADSLLQDYLLENFHLEVNGKEIRLAYLGKEPEDDAMWCYLESEMVDTPEEITVRNTILTELFEEQVNIIQTYVGGWNRGLLLSGQNPRGSLSVGK